jgi:hypothetical protein
MNDSGWKRSLWEFFTMGIGFWISKPEKSTVEKVGIGLMAIFVFVVTICM